MHLALVLIVLPLAAASVMDLLRNVFKSGRDDIEKNGIMYPAIYSGKRYQPRVPDYVPFPCDTTFGRSARTPESVHLLRPGDIDVVGGLGDSLVAGSGALEEFAIGTFIEARGVSWCVGGQGDWRRFLTVPNLLKVFNPNLMGYSTGTGEFISSKAKLNIAFPVAATEDAMHQARILVQRIRSNPKINVNKHWKLVTIFFGANDICSAQCFNPMQFSPIRYALNIRRALDYLETVLPRTLVNLVPVIVAMGLTRRLPIFRELARRRPFLCARGTLDLGGGVQDTRGWTDVCGQTWGIKADQIARSLDNCTALDLELYNTVSWAGNRKYDVTVSIRVPRRSAMCHFLHPLYCACMHKGNRPDVTASKMSHHYQQAVEALIQSGRYDNSDDFTVVLQPFIKLFNAPKANPSQAPPIDPSLVTYDCFHFSQRGHALGANLLWNNMLEPVGNKTERGLPEVFERLLCPTESAPYIYTNVNSRRFRATGRQDGMVTR